MTATALDARLRNRVSQFVSYSSRFRDPLTRFVRNLTDSADDVFLFGGVPRQLLFGRGHRRLRDLDFVVQTDDLDALLSRLGAHVKGFNRFGGAELNVEGWSVDLWPLDETWAFREQHIKPVSPAALPRTTHLSIDAIAVSLKTAPGRARLVYEAGFFRSVDRQIVDLNLSINPFPILAALRALVLASKYELALTPRLQQYIVQVADDVPVARWATAASPCYKGRTWNPRRVDRWIGLIRESTDVAETTALRLPSSETQQLQLWETQDWARLTGRRADVTPV